MFDLLLINVSLLDPSQRLSRPGSLGITGDRIAWIGDETDLASRQRVDLAGRTLVPGLIDLHTHIFVDETHWGVEPRWLGSRVGPTTIVDAGSSGALNYSEFTHSLVGVDDTEVVAFLNIGKLGMTAEAEAASLDLIDVAGAAECALAHPSSIRGIKVRATVDAVGDLALLPVLRAKEAALLAGIPLMVHVGVNGPPLLRDILSVLEKGDILTHTYHGGDDSLLAGANLDLASGAQARGVLMDVGHGAASFSFAVAEAALSAGLRPDTISTDLHAESLHGPAISLIATMNKWLLLGLQMEQIILATTWRPAQVLRLSDHGSLLTGSIANLTILEFVDQPVRLQDGSGETRVLSRTLRAAGSIFHGRLVEPSDAVSEPLLWRIQ